MIADTSTTTGLAVLTRAGWTWRRLFWIGRINTRQVWAFAAGSGTVSRAELLHSSATLQAGALALALALPW